MPLIGVFAEGKRVKPSAPVISTITAPTTGSLSVSFTVVDGGLPITSLAFTSSPSVTLTTSSTSSPATVTGTFAAGTTYAITMTATNSLGTSDASNSVSLIPNPIYVLSTTFNASGNFTVPAGRNMLALVGASAGGAGGGGNATRTGGGGGGSGAGFSIRDIPVTPGTNYAVTIAGAGAATTFGSILTANGGNNGVIGTRGNGGTITYNAGVADTAAAGVVGGSPNSGAGANSATANSNIAQIAAFNYGGGGGAGGLGGYDSNGGAGGTAGTPGAGAGGQGGNFISYNSANAGSSGAGANLPGGGGGGGGGGSLVASGSPQLNAGAGGAGGGAQILVYVK